MTIISKTAGGLSLFSCLSDMHKTAVLSSNNEHAKASADTFIETSLASQKANYVSYKDAKRKNWLLKNNFMGGINETYGRIKGYFKGFFSTGVRYIPNFILSLGAIIPKNKVVANISALGLGLVEIWDFIKNSSGIFERNDYLNLK